MEYRVRSSGELKTRSQLKNENKNMSFPKVWNDAVHDALGVDYVFTTPQPAPSSNLKETRRDGVEQDAGGRWVEKWIEVDKFSDTTEDGVTTTKAEHEAAHQTYLDEKMARNVRADRDERLAKTDWRAASDLTLSTEWTNYRQALRDVPAQDGFPHTVTWPDEP